MSKPTTLLLGTVAGHLPLAPVSLPHGAYDDAVAILGRRGRGKTVTAATVIEGLHKPEYKPPMPFKASAPLKAGTKIQTPGALLVVGGAGTTGTHTPLHEGITVPELTILTSICQFHMIGNAAPRRVAAAALAGYTAGGGRFRNLLGGLRGKGLVDYPGDDRVSLTPAGQALVPKSSQVRVITQADMYAKVGQLLKESERKVMEAVIRAPVPLTREQLAQDSGYDMKGGRFRNILGTLRSMDFISYPEEGMVHVSQGLRVGA